VSEPKNGRKRSLLAQERSRDTRQGIIKAAVELWSERGYADSGADPTAEEIADRAGVSKATFYLHFARKDDILLHTGWVTTRVFYEDALEALLAGGTPESVIDAVTALLCRRIEKSPRVVMRRILRAQATSSGKSPSPDDPDHFGFDRGFTLVFRHFQQAGELPGTVPAAALAGMFEAMLYASFREWAHDDDADLLAMLRTRFAVLLAGARSVSPAVIRRAAPAG
jgi:AcrR family transcriptional regulator